MDKINRTEILKVRLTEKEKLNLEEISSKTGLDYSKIVRKALLDFKLNYERREEKRTKCIWTTEN